MSGHPHTPKATGIVRPSEFFQFVEATTFDPHHVVRVLRGELAGVMFRGAVEPQVCARVAENFSHHPQLRIRNDEAQARFLGTFHYQKTMPVYLDEAATFRDTMHHVFDGCDNAFQHVMSSLGAALAPDGVTVRVASHEGRDASEFVMRSWSGEGQFSLEPHDDCAQLNDERQRGFEIQRVAAGPAVAFNLCLQTPGAGELHYWNLEPDDAMRQRLGLQDTGYPYPLEVLEGIDKVVVPVRAGDLYFFNGKLIHAVAAQDKATGYRSTISGLMGFCDPQTVIYWS